MQENSRGDWQATLESQAGVAGRRQALQVGRSREMLRRRLEPGKWRRLRRGVYATFSGPLSRQAELWAGLLRRQGLNGARTTYIGNLYEGFEVCTEVDGNAARPPDQRWDDIRRDNANTARGSVTLGFSWSDVTQHPCRSAMLIAATLRERGWTGKPRPCSPECPLRQ